VMVHSDAKGASVPSRDEAWTVGQHPAVASGWIVRPVLFGSRVRVLPECEGGHVLLKSEDDAWLIAAAPAMRAALEAIANPTYGLGFNKLRGIAKRVLRETSKPTTASAVGTSKASEAND
jgi:hypothetical protein